MSLKQKLEQKLWNIADTLRGKMGADEFRDYILGFIFYKYLSESMSTYAQKWIDREKNLKGKEYQDIDENSKDSKEFINALREEAVETLGYFLKPSELFHTLAKRGNAEGKTSFILTDLS